MQQHLTQDQESKQWEEKNLAPHREAAIPLRVVFKAKEEFTCPLLHHMQNHIKTSWASAVNWFTLRATFNQPSQEVKRFRKLTVINETAPLLLFNLGSKGSSLFSWRPHENSPPCSNAYLSPSPSVRGRTEKIPNDISNQVQATWWSSTSLGLGKNWLQKITMGRCIELPYPSHKDFGDRAFASTPFSCTRVAIIIGFTRRFCPVNATTVKEASTC